MARIPSLRNLRRNSPENVAILPTAAERQVQQRYGRAFAAAKSELIASQPVAFPHQLPFWREAEQQAKSLELRADVPAFDPDNPSHLRAWEAIWDVGRRLAPSDRD